MKEYIFLLLITYVLWIILTKIVSNAKLKNICIMPLLLITYIFVYDAIKNGYYFSEKPFIMMGLWFVLDNEPREKLRCIVTVLVFSNVIEMIMLVLEKIFNVNNTVKPEILIMAVCLCILLIIYFVKQRRKTEKKPKNFDIYMYLMIGMFGIAVTVVTDSFKYNTDRLYEYSVVLSVSVVFNTLLSVIFLMYMIINNDVISRYYNMEKQMNEEQKIYYEMLLKKEEETKKFRHDIKNQLINIRKLAEESEDKRVVEYTKEISGDIEDIGNMVYKTGNRNIDVMLNYYICKLDKGIHVCVRGMAGNNIFVDDSDLNIMFGNIFKNIWEELKNCKTGFVNIECITGDEFSRIVVENSFDENKKNQFLKKQKGRNFGYGIYNIKKAAKRNYVKVECERTEEKYMIGLVFKNIKLPFEELSNPSRRNG